MSKVRGPKSITLEDGLRLLDGSHAECRPADAIHEIFRKLLTLDFGRRMNRQ